MRLAFALGLALAAAYSPMAAPAQPTAGCRLFSQKMMHTYNRMASAPNCAHQLEGKWDNEGRYYRWCLEAGLEEASSAEQQLSREFSRCAGRP